MPSKITSKICMIRDLGVSDNLFGGSLMLWIDESAAIYARQVTGEERMVTLKFEMLFKHPIHEGEIIEFYGDNASIGNTSVSFNVFAKVKDVIVFSTKCVFVAVDENGNKKIIWKK